MCKKIIIIIILIISPLFLSAEDKFKNPELLFTLSRLDRIIFFGSPQEGMTGAVALEYHNGYLYIAMLDRILKTDLSGSVINVVANKPRKKIFLDNSFESISDITFINNELIMYSQSYRKLIILNNDQIRNKYFIDFYSKNLEETTKAKKNPFYFQPHCILNISNKLFFYDGYHTFPLDSLVAYSDSGMIKERNVDLIYINKKQKPPIIGNPITNCKILKTGHQVQSVYDNSLFAIDNICSKKGLNFYIDKNIYSKELKNLQIFEVYKNVYLNTYYIFGRISGNKYIVFLNSNFIVTQIVKNIIYHTGFSGATPFYECSFSSDEKGNVYYCTNNLDLEKGINSVVEIYKIYKQ